MEIFHCFYFLCTVENIVVFLRILLVSHKDDDNEAEQQVR